MKKFILTLGILLSICAFAQEKKQIVIIPHSNEPFSWDLYAPIHTIDGDTIAYLEVATLDKIKNISFTIEWICKDGRTITTTEKSILRSGNKFMANDLPEFFFSFGIWYNIYILPSPPVSPWDVQMVTFSGKFLTEQTWQFMGKDILFCQ